MKIRIINCILKAMTMRSVPWLLVVAPLYLAVTTVLCGYGTLLQASANRSWLVIPRKVSYPCSYSEIFLVHGVSSLQCCVGPEPEHRMFRIYGWDCSHLEFTQRTMSTYSNRTHFSSWVAWPYCISPCLRCGRLDIAYLGPRHWRTTPHARCPCRCNHVLPTRRVQGS